MALRTVLTWPHPVLREIAVPVECFDTNLATLVADLFDTMYDEEGVGLAATQIGVKQCVVVIDCGAEEPHPIALINPKIVEHGGEITWPEGCLSIPGVRADIERAAEVTVEYQDLEGTPCALKATGLTAVCIQHELDHLEGRMYFDHLGHFERKAVLNAYEDHLNSRGESGK